MLSATMKYGGMRAKIMAMYGKMLADEDFVTLRESKTVTDISSFLRNHHGWDESIGGLSPAPSAEVLKIAVKDRLYSDYERLFVSSFGQDRSFLRFIITRAEYSLILMALRRLCAGERHEVTLFSEFICRHSSFDVPRLLNCRDFAELIKTIHGSIYERPLAKLSKNLETGLPDYGQAAIILENIYYNEAYQFAQENYKGHAKQLLQEFLGAEADLINVVSLLRLHHNFPGSLPNSERLLIPVTGRLKLSIISAIQNARNDEEATEIIRRSPLGRSLGEIDPHRLELSYERAMMKLCRKLIKAPEPSICDAQAFLSLRELECRKIIRIIDAVDCGIDPNIAI